VGESLRARGSGARYASKGVSPIFFDYPHRAESIFPGASGPVPEPASQSLYGKRLSAYEKTVSLIREEKFQDALSFIKRQGKDVREWTGMMSLEAALLTGSDGSEALKIYDRIFDKAEKDLHFSRALSGYKFLLMDLSSKGDYGARFRLIKCLAFEWRNREARELLKETLKEEGVPEALRNELKAFGATLAIREGDLGEALEFFKGRTDPSSLRWLSVIYVRKGEFKRAAEAREKALVNLKGTRRLREYAKVFDILAKGGLVKEAEELLLKVPELKDRVPAYSFYLGLGSLIKGDPEEALKYLESETKEKGERGRRAQYFKGRALEMLLRFSDAFKAYDLGRKGSFDYYSLLSEGRYLKLRDGGRSGKGAKGSAGGSAAGQEGEAKAYGSIPSAVLLLNMLKSPTGEDAGSMGFYLWLTERLPQPWPGEREPYAPKGIPGGELSRVKSSVFHHLYLGAPERALREITNAPNGLASKKSSPITEENARLALLLARFGEYDQAVMFLNSFSVKDPSLILGRWNHPLVYGEEIGRAYRLYGLSPGLILSVIRTESAFQKDAVSVSNARGLMQLLPSTAEKLSVLLNDPKPRDEDLFDPYLNIRYGSYYLSLLIESFGSVPMALCAYNGGPFNMESLIAVRGNLSMDLFAETLPFSETSSYLRRVLTANFTYEKAYLGKGNYPDLTGTVTPPQTPHPGF
jgi:soluble lytic murein transglycosylase